MTEHTVRGGICITGDMKFLKNTPYIWTGVTLINDKSFLQLTEQMHEAVFDMGAWDGVLESLVSLFNGSFSVLMNQVPNSGLAELLASTKVDKSAAKLYEQHYGPISPLVPYAHSFGVGEIFTEQMIPDQNEYLRSETYNDFFRPNDGEHLIQTLLSKDSSLSSTILIRRDAKLGAFNSNEMLDFNRLIPHFRQTTRVYQALAQAERKEAALTDTIEHLNVGVLLIDYQGRVTYHNRAADMILEDSDGFSIDRFGKCALSLRDEMDSFSRLLGQVCQCGKSVVPHPGDAVRVSRPSFMRPYTLWVSPVRQVGKGRDGHPAAIIFISDPEKSHELLPQMIARQYGLTPAETRLTAALVDGKCLREAADEFGITINTARTVLKIIFSKTNVNQQSALVSLMLTSPPINSSFTKKH